MTQSYIWKILKAIYMHRETQLLELKYSVKLQKPNIQTKFVSLYTNKKLFENKRKKQS